MNRAKTIKTISIIIIITILWLAFHTQKPAAAAAPLAIRRESAAPIFYMVALDHSLRAGDGRLIDWDQITWSEVV